MLILLDSSLGQDQIFSENIVEQKRHGRTLVAVLNGMSIAEAAREGMITDERATTQNKLSSGRSNMFLSQNAEDEEDEEVEEEPEKVNTAQSFGSFNPQANPFTPGAVKTSSVEGLGTQPSWMTGFGQARPSASAFSSTPSNFFGQQQKTASSNAPASAPQSGSQGLGTTQAPSQLTAPAKVDFASSSQATNLETPSATSQSNPFSNNNPFAAAPPTQVSSGFSFAKPDQASAPPQEQQTASTAAAKPTFSWFKSATDPVPDPTPSPSAFAAPPPSKTPSVTPSFSCKSQPCEAGLKIELTLSLKSPPSLRLLQLQDHSILESHLQQILPM